MDKTSHAGHTRRLATAAAAVTFVVAAAAVTFVVAAAVLAPLPAAVAQRRPQPQAKLKPRLRTGVDALKDCFITDKNGRKWACSRRIDPAANLTVFACAVENRMSAEMEFDCNDDMMPFYAEPGETVGRSYDSVFDPAPPHRQYTVQRTGPRVSCVWGYAGNYMRGVVVWDEQWPEAWSCRDGPAGDGRCKLVFENREVAIVTGAGGRRVLGDLAVKECSKTWYGRWLPWSLGCTYPKHDHPYVGTVGK